MSKPPFARLMTADTVLALGFDLFFKPKMSAAAEKLGVQLVYARPDDAAAKAAQSTRIVADVSVAGVAEALEAIRKAHPDVPVLACYPHVEEHRAVHVRAIGGKAITRGAFNANLEDALSGRW